MDQPVLGSSTPGNEGTLAFTGAATALVAILGMLLLLGGLALRRLGRARWLNRLR